MKLHTKSQLIIIAVSSMVIFGFIACKKLDLGAVTKIKVETVTIIGANSVSVEINIFDLSDDVHSDYGVCYSTNNTLPTTLDSKVSKGALKNKTKENVVIQGLQPGIKIYIRSFVMNGNTPQYSFNVMEAIPKHMPTATKLAITNITAGAATLHSTVNANTTSATVVFEYGTSASFGQTINATPNTISGTANTNVSASLTGLQANTNYHVRLKATCTNGTTYSADTTFNTLQISGADVTTSPVSNITHTSANSGGYVTGDGGSPVTARGVCWNTTQNPTIAYSHTSNGNGTGSFGSSITGLQPSTVYYVRAFATNGQGTAYGNQVSFTTSSAPVPSVTTTNPTAINAFAATCGGNVTYDNGFAVTARGVCWNTQPKPTLQNNHSFNGNGLGAFISYLSGLSQNTVYYVRAYATNSQGTSYGNEKTFTTLQIFKPSVTTLQITNITNTTATCGGNVTSDGGDVVTVRGVCWSTIPSPTIGNNHTTDGSGTGQFSSNITGLTLNTTYYVRAFATNSQGTAYGNQESFTTLNLLCPASFTDPRDGKVYYAVLIENQCWMKQNMNIGIRKAGNSNQSNNGTIEKYCYNNSDTQCNVYGGLYQWDEMMQYSTTQGVQGICASGWHIPTDAEWTILTTYLGGESVAGGKMKESGTAHWNSPNTGATNSSGFTALPGGNRNTDGSFDNQGLDAFFWSATQNSSTYAWSRGIVYSSGYLHRNNNNQTGGFSVRCIKD